MTSTLSKKKLLVIALFLIITIDTMGVGFVWPLFGPMFSGKIGNLFDPSVSMQSRNVLYGVTIGIASLFAFLSAPLLGDISDHIGRRRVLIFCLIGTAIGMLISIVGIVFNQVLFLILSRAWLGATAASQAIAQAVIVDISTTDNKPARLGISSAAGNIGYIFGPIISGYLVDSSIVSWFSLTTPFYFALVIALLGLLILLKSYKKDHIINTHEQKPSLLKRIFMFSRVFADKNICRAALSYLCLQVGWAFYLQGNFLILIQKYDYSSRALGNYLSLLGIIFCFSLLVLVRILTKHISLKKLMLFNLMLAAICCFYVSVYHSKTAIWFNIVPMAIAVAIASNAILVTFSNIAKSSEQGWVMGIGNSSSAFAWALVPVVVGVLVTFSFSASLYLAGLSFICAFILGYMFDVRVNQEASK